MPDGVTEVSKQRPCRCKERAAAMQRASLAFIKRDRESFQREMDFVRKTLIEDFGNDDAKRYLEGVRKWTRNLVKGLVRGKSDAHSGGRT